MHRFFTSGTFSTGPFSEKRLRGVPSEPDRSGHEHLPFEKEQGRDAHHKLQACASFGIVVDIHLGHLDLVPLYWTASASTGEAEGLAGAAPGGPEVDQGGLVRLEDPRCQNSPSPTCTTSSAIRSSSLKFLANYGTVGRGMSLGFDSPRSFCYRLMPSNVRAKRRTTHTGLDKENRCSRWESS